MGVLGSQSWWTPVWYFFVGKAAVIFIVLIPVLISIQCRTYTVQLQNFAFEDCRKSHFNLNPDAVLVWKR